MVRLRCTRKLLARMRAVPEEDGPPSQGRLGDWTAHVTSLVRVPVVICVNDLTLFPVLLPLKESRTLVDRFRLAALEGIRGLGVDPAVLAEEAAALGEIRVGRAVNRSVLGSINQFLLECRYYRHPHGATVADLEALAADLRDSLSGALGYRKPSEAMRDLLSAARERGEVIPMAGKQVERTARGSSAVAGKPRAKSVCGLCGKTRKLTRTQCCDRLICDDEDKYVMFSYGRNSCHRNHRRLTLCGYHFTEEHKGDWKVCFECRRSFETEMYVYYGTNEYNFEQLPDPPAFEPTRCCGCGVVLDLARGGYSMLGTDYRCVPCTVTDIERRRRIRSSRRSTPEKKR